MRASVALGYESFRDLQAALREDFREATTPTGRLDRTLQGLEAAAEKAVTAAEATLQRDERLLAKAQALTEFHLVEKAAQLIGAGRVVHLFGVGLSAAAVVGLDYRLTRLGIPTNPMMSEDRATLQRVLTASEDDCVVAFAFYPIPDGLRMLRRAIATAQAASVLIGSAEAEITDEFDGFDVHLPTPQGPLSELTTITPAVAMASALAFTVAGHRPDAAKKAYRTFQALTEETSSG